MLLEIKVKLKMKLPIGKKESKKLKILEKNNHIKTESIKFLIGSKLSF